MTYHVTISKDQANALIDIFRQLFDQVIPHHHEEHVKEEHAPKAIASAPATTRKPGGRNKRTKRSVKTDIANALLAKSA